MFWSSGLSLVTDRSRIEYNKKPGKPAVIKVIKDNAVPRDDLYKSGTIHTGQGESPNSRSRPTPRAKRIPGKPITNGKLLRPGGPTGGPKKLVSGSNGAPPQSQQPPRQSHIPAQARLTPQASLTQTRPMPQPVAAQPRLVPHPLAGVNGANHGRSPSAGSFAGRAPPPPPPSTPPATRKDLWRVLYDFGSEAGNELSISKDELIEVLQREDNGRRPGIQTMSFSGSTDVALFRLVSC